MGTTLSSELLSPGKSDNKGKRLIQTNSHANTLQAHSISLEFQLQVADLSQQACTRIQLYLCHGCTVIVPRTSQAAHMYIGSKLGPRPKPTPEGIAFNYTASDTHAG